MLAKFREFISILNQAKKANLLVAGFLIGALGLTVAVAQYQTRIRQEASEVVSPPTPTGNITLALSAINTQVVPNTEIPVDMYIEAGNQNVTGLSFTLLSSDSSVLEMKRVSFIDTTLFNNQLKNEVLGTDKYYYAAVDTLGKTVSGKVKIGTIILSAKKAGSSDIRFHELQATALGQAGLLGNQQNVNIQFTVVSPTTPTIPQPTATPVAQLPIVSNLTLKQATNSLLTQIEFTCTPDPKKRIAAGIFYFGDGTPDYTYPTLGAVGAPVFLATSHAYQSAGTYTVSARCKDDSGIIGIPVSKNITLVAIPTPTGNVGIGKTSPQVTLTIVPPTATPTKAAVLGDADGNGIVNIVDYNIWREEYLALSNTKRADFNKDGKVDLIDFNIWRNAFNPSSPTSTPSGSTLSPTPSPASDTSNNRFTITSISSNVSVPITNKMQVFTVTAKVDTNMNVHMEPNLYSSGLYFSKSDGAGLNNPGISMKAGRVESIYISTVPFATKEGTYTVKAIINTSSTPSDKTNMIEVPIVIKVTSVPQPSTPSSSSYKRVFKTSTDRSYQGNLIVEANGLPGTIVNKGLDAADKICQYRASYANLGGTWKAWLSDSKTSAASRITHASVPYKRLDGQNIANNWSDLTDGTLQTTISITEFGIKSLDAGAWTNTLPSGERKYTQLNSTCQDWTTASTGTSSQGADFSTNSQWTDYATYSCGFIDSLYCFEQ